MQVKFHLHTKEVPPLSITKQLTEFTYNFSSSIPKVAQTLRC